MRRKSTLWALVLTLALVIGSFQSVFAGTGPATQATKDAIEKAGVQCIQKIKNEVDAEKVAMQLCKEVKSGKYELMDTAAVKKEIGTKTVILDVMPQGWWAQRHLPGAICSEAGVTGPEFKMTAEQKAQLLKKVKAAVGKKKVKKWYNKKTKKWTTKKPAKKYRGKSKKVKVVNKDKKIVVYCGFVGCARSHEAAKYLVSKGYTNVYRYPGGISAWVDAGNAIEGTDIQ